MLGASWFVNDPCLFSAYIVICGGSASIMLSGCVSGTISIRFVAAGIAGVGSVAIVRLPSFFLKLFLFSYFPYNVPSFNSVGGFLVYVRFNV